MSMRFKVNHTTAQDPIRMVNTEEVMYTEQKRSDVDFGGIDCITDRTKADVDRIKELNAKILNLTITEEEYNEYLKNMKGALNYSDLDRIERNMQTIVDLFTLEDDGFTITLEDMTRDYIPRVPYFQVLLRNVKKLRDTMYILPTTPKVPSLPLSTYKNWNAIEQILYDVYWYRRRHDRRLYYCGEIYADNDVLI